MAAALTMKSESTLTDRYQTTIPETVRKALRLGKRDKICYSIKGDGHVVLSRVETGNEDPALSHFLNFLARDISEHPDRIQILDTGLVNRIQSLTADVEFDLGAPLSDEDE